MINLNPKLILLLSFIILTSCNRNTPEKKVSVKVVSDYIDYHKIIDLTIAEHYEKEVRQYNFDIKYIGENDNETLINLDYLIKRTDSKPQSDLIKQLLKKQDSFVFNKSKLDEKTAEILTLKETKTYGKIIYVFNSFLSNEAKDSIIANISVIYTNEKYGGINGGWEEIVFFSKENDYWKIDKRMEFIEY